MYMVESRYGITVAMSPAPDPHRLPAAKGRAIHLHSDGVQETGPASAKALGWNMASGKSPEKGSQMGCGLR